jgi:hypothetical protein
MKLQRDFTDDSKRTVRKISVDPSPMCKIPPSQVEKFWKDRWEQCPDFKQEEVNSRFPIKRFFNMKMNKEMLDDLFNVEKMIALISKRGNLSAPRLDGITFPFLKLEKESAAEMIVEMLKYMVVKKRIPQIWKTAKTILIYKGGEESNPGNWHPISLTSVIYRVIFGRISQVIMDMEDRPNKKTILLISQKGFVPRVNGCGEHIAAENIAIYSAIKLRRTLYMLALDMRDAFGSVSHKQLENNLIKLNFCRPIRNIILDSYRPATIKIVTLDGLTNEINIKRGVKQGCPLSPILFYICVNPLIEKLNSSECKKLRFCWNTDD